MTEPTNAVNLPTGFYFFQKPNQFGITVLFVSKSFVQAIGESEMYLKEDAAVTGFYTPITVPRAIDQKTKPE